MAIPPSIEKERASISAYHAICIEGNLYVYTRWNEKTINSLAFTPDSLTAIERFVD